MGIYLGIDGGGSKTSCVIGDDEKLLGQCTVGGSNVIRVGAEQAQEALSNGINEVCQIAKVTPTQISRTCIGIAGAGRPEIAEIVRRTLSTLVSGEILIVGDMVIAKQAAFGSGPGIVVIAGTGSIAYGRNSEGQTARAGGWGFAISDEGSGQWIGRAAVASVMRAYDEGRDSTLLQHILQAWKLKSREQLIGRANAASSPDFPALFPAVLSASESGDSLAREVLQKAGKELVVLAQMVASRLFRSGENVPVAMAGGIFRNSAIVRNAFSEGLCGGPLHVNVDGTVIDPVDGALALARASHAADRVESN
ncbi:MAG: N-acetylglucosamine kinase [Terriglobales bacterium]